MNRCPNCGKNIITNFNKIKVGPVNLIKCPNCKKDLTVPMITALYNFIYYFAVIFCFIQFDMSLSSFVLLWFVVTLVHIYIHIKFLPLIVEED